MLTSSMRHPAFESFRDRDRRKAREELRRFLAAQEARDLALAGRRILPAIIAPFAGNATHP